MTQHQTPLCACGKPTTGAQLCDRCEQTLAYALVHVGVYWTDLDVVATKRTRYGVTGGKGAIGKAQPLPVDLRFINQAIPDDPGRVTAHHGAQLAPGSQLKWDTWNTMVAWCRTVMEDVPDKLGPACVACLHVSCAAIRRDRWPTNTVPAMVNYLARQMRFVLAQTWAPLVLDELLDLERRLTRMVNRPADRWYAGKCSAKDLSGNTCTAELYASEDRGEIVCPACSTRHDVAGRRDFLLDEAKAYLVTATEAAGALLAWTDYDGSESKLVDRIRKWRDRDRLEVADVTSLNGRDRHLYRLGDIQALLVDDAQTRQTRRIGA